LANGRVIDPETYTDTVLNIGIKGATIVAISKEPLKGKDVVDVSGKIISPGFIDTHAHSQNIPSNRVQAHDGVTTAVELEAGVLPIGEFYKNSAAEGRAINYGASAGWGFARLATMNPEKGGPIPDIAWPFHSFNLKEWVEDVSTHEQLEKIIALTEQGLKEGGIGIGVLHGYCPGAGPKEMLRLWQLAKKYNVPTCTHIQNLSMQDPKSGTGDMINLMGLAAATGAHTHVCHWNSTSLRDIPVIRDIVNNAQRAGLKITTEAYVYGAGCSAIGASEFNPDDMYERMQVKFSDMTLVKTNKDFETKEEFVKARTENPADSCTIHFLHEETDPHDAALLDMAVLYPGIAICTDSIPWMDDKGVFYTGKEWPLPKGLGGHPRGAGNYCRFLRKWVRERGVISWMDAIRQASLNACFILEEACPSFKKKGRIQVGCDADLIVFDPETVTDMGTFPEGLQLSKGMMHVLVNGTFLIRNEVLDTEAFPGRAMRAPVKE
jgi:N-acyl-D-glutamate deacylase